MACQLNRKESVDKAVDDNEGKGYDDDVKRLYRNANTPQCKQIQSSLAEGNEKNRRHDCIMAGQSCSDSSRARHDTEARSHCSLPPVEMMRFQIIEVIEQMIGIGLL
jgi:hypothetical protein